MEVSDRSVAAAEFGRPLKTSLNQPALIGRVALPGWLDAESLQQELEYLEELRGHIAANKFLLRDILYLQPASPCIYIGDDNPHFPPGLGIAENLLAGWVFAVLFEELFGKKIWMTGTPPFNSPLISIGSGGSTRPSALIDGCDPDDPLRTRVSNPMAGQHFYFEFASGAGEEIFSYLSSFTVREGGWVIIDKRGEVFFKPQIYPSGKHAGFAQNGALEIIVIKGSPIIVVAGIHPGDTAAMAQVFAYRPLLQKVLNKRGKMDNFQVLIAIAKVEPNDARKFMTVARTDLILENVEPLGRIDERLLLCFRDDEILVPRLFTAHQLLGQYLCARGAEARTVISLIRGRRGSS